MGPWRERGVGTVTEERREPGGETRFGRWQGLPRVRVTGKAGRRGAFRVRKGSTGEWEERW